MENLNSSTNRTEEEIRHDNIMMHAMEMKMKADAEQSGRGFHYKYEKPVITNHLFGDNGICIFCHRVARISKL